MRAFLVLAGLASLAAQPRYDAGSVVNAVSQQPGRHAVRGLVTVYGANLLRGRDGWPTVYFGTGFALVTYASATQVNFVIPMLRPGKTQFRIAAQTVGPAVDIEFAAEAPELAADADGFAVAVHADGRPVTAEDPARPGDVVHLFGTGFGATYDDLPNRRANVNPLSVVTPAEIWLDGVLLPAESTPFQGMIPLNPQNPENRGQYRVELRIPAEAAADPVIQLGYRGEPSSRTGVRLRVRPLAAE